MSSKIILENYAQQKFFTHASYLATSSINHSTKLICYPDSLASQEGIYDVASLTKIFVTGSMLAHTLDQKMCELTTPLSMFKCFQKFKNIDPQIFSKIMIGDLVSHTSGLAPWFPFYSIKDLNDPKLWKVIFDKVQNDGKRRYSDIGFICLGKVLEELWQMKIDVWFHKYIIQKLQLKNTGYRHQLNHLKNEQFIATSMGNPFEKYLAIKVLKEWETDLTNASVDYSRAEEIIFRKHRLQGECNDGNCFYMGQVAPHAGLFSTAKELAIIVDHWLDQSFHYQKIFKKFLDISTHEKQYLFCTNHDTLNWNENASLFGHHGFTGCSFSMNKDFSKYRIFLSNRQFFGLDLQNNYPQWKKILSPLMELD
jgi:CubicO group peptidase (beta-lactamase class C family)